MSQQFPHLFQPIRIGAKQSRNRIMQLATTTGTGQNGAPSERTIAYHRRVARGGTGIIVSETMRVHPSNAGHNASAILLYRKETVPVLARMAAAIKDEGALFVVQLNHGGRQHHSQVLPTMAGPSAIACPHSGGIPHQMSKQEIADIVAGFGKAALHAKEAGCDGVEIHGAQGHLIQEFFSAFSNQRDDEYGGSLENRLRFVSEIIATVRDQVGPDFIVGYRMGIEEFSPEGITVEQSKQGVAHLAKLGMIDYLSLAQGNFDSIDAHLPDSHFPPMTYVDMQSQVKPYAGGLPVIVSARISTPEQAEGIIAAGKADIVGLCRPLIADPEWPQKALEGRSAEICRCISTSYCWSAGGGRALSCELNPTVGNELDPPITKATAPKRVVIVGAGPAGMEAACTVAQCGHQVVLLEKGAKPGGKLNFAHHYLEFHESGYALDYLLRRVAKAGIEVRTNTPGTLESVLKEKPDAVIVAAGSEIYAPKIAGDGSVPVVVYSKLEKGATVVVMDEDGYYWASCVTEQLARRGCKVVYATRFHEPLRELAEVSRISALRVMDELGVEFLTHMYVERSDGGDVILRHYLNRKRELRVKGAGNIVWVGAQRANDRLAHELRAAGVKDVKLIGDAYMPRRLSHAFAEGYRAARSI